LATSSIHALLWDIVILSQKAANAILLTFPSRLCSLIRVPFGSNYYRFAQNARETKWIQAAILASAGEAEVAKEMAASFLLTYLGKKYEDAFAFSATKLGVRVLLKPKVMDAATGAAMWQEANCPVRVQHIIL
jgi:hypothetical protein